MAEQQQGDERTCSDPNCRLTGYHHYCDPKVPAVAIGPGEVDAAIATVRAHAVQIGVPSITIAALAPASACGAQTYASDDQGLFCRHCGRSHVRHAHKQGVGFVCDAPASASIPADVELIQAALNAYRSLPAGTVRDFPHLEARSNDPNDTAHSVLSARLPGLREEYEEAKAKVARVDAVIAALAAQPSTGGAMDGEGSR